jgi:hypothetical protein
MVIHELVTNAAKHGALSSPDGSVSVSWDWSSVNAAEVLAITWNELGGPPIAAPVQSGYGSSLIRDLIPYELGGSVDLTFPSDGACCKIEIPLGAGVKILGEDTLRSAIVDDDAFSTGIRKFFRMLRITAQQEIKKAACNADARRKLTGTTLPAKAVVTIGGIDLKFELDGHIELT